MQAWEHSPLTDSTDADGFDESEFEEDGEFEGEKDSDEMDLEEEVFGEEEYEEYEEYEEFGDVGERRHAHPRRADWDG